MKHTFGVLAKVRQAPRDLIKVVIQTPKKRYQIRARRTGEVLATVDDGVVKVEKWVYQGKDQKLLTDNLDNSPNGKHITKDDQGNAGFCNSKGECFVAGTLIHTSNGYKKIEAIKPRDLVWSYNTQTGKKELRKVVKTFVRTTQQLIYLYLGNQVIKTTIEHPFYLEGKWVTARNLSRGDSLYLFHSRKIALDSLKNVDTTVTVYNFSVARNHNYYVGKEGTLVHNADLYGLLEKIEKLNLQALKTKLDDLGNLKAQFWDDFASAKDVDDLLKLFNEKPSLVEGWKVLNEAGESVLRIDLKEIKHVTRNLETINSIGYRQWLKIRKNYSQTFINVDQSNYEQFLSETANAVKRSGNQSNCTAVSISVGRKLLGKPILDGKFFLESYVGKNGVNGVSVLEEHAIKLPRDISNPKKPFINGFPHRPGDPKEYLKGFNNLYFVKRILDDAPNGSSFIFGSFKGIQNTGHGQGFTGHAFNVIKDKNGIIKFLDGQLERKLEFDVGLDRLLIKMKGHGREVILPGGTRDTSLWYIFDASKL